MKVNIESMVISGRINMAAWSNGSGVMLVGRHVTEPAQAGESDGGSLVAGRIDEGGSYSGETVVRDREGEVFLEDPRVAWALGGLVCGLTAVVWEDKEKAYKAYPAVAKIEDEVEVKLRELKVLKELGWGKNTTPMVNDLFLFRPDRENYKLVMFRYSGGQAETVGEVPFAPVPEWGEHRIGTGMPPIWHEDGRRAAIVLHGMTYDPGRDFYTYSLGRGFLEEGSGWRISVCPEPLFRGKEFAQWPQLHPELRLAIYNTGGVTIGDSLRLFINVGDKCTIARDIPLAELWKNW